MDFQMVLQQVCSYHGWARAYSHEGARIEVQTEYVRTQVVECTMGQDPDGRYMAYIWSRVAQVNMIQDPWYLLQLNANFAYGGLAVRGHDVLLMETQLLETADAEEIMRAVYYVAKFADELEKQIIGYDQN